MRNFSRLVEIARGLKNGSRENEHRNCHVAFLLKGSRIYSIGQNSTKTNSISGRYKATRKNEEKYFYSAGTHAEQSCIARVKYDKKNLSQFSMVVIRINNEGEGMLANSRPCCNCQFHLKKSTLRNIWYSTDEGKFEKMKV